MSQEIDQQQIRFFGSLELLARQAVEGFITGLHKSPYHGFSVEFAEHRLYNTGESTRHIDWKLFARSDKLFVKRYEEETNLRCQLVIDQSSSMHFPLPEKGAKNPMNKLTFSIYAAASLIYLLRRQRDAVGLSLFADQVDLHTPAKSSATHQKYLFHELEQLLEPDRETPKQTFAVDALHQIAENIHKRSLVVIFSDMFDNSKQGMQELFSALQHLKHNRHEVILFNTVDKSKEVDFEFENRPYTFVDLESGERVKLHPKEVREQYVEAMDAYEKELKLRCAQYHIDYIEADINQGFKQILLAYLIKRSKMY